MKKQRKNYTAEEKVPIVVGHESDLAIIAPLSNVVRDARRNRTRHSRHGGP